MAHPLGMRPHHQGVKTSDLHLLVAFKRGLHRAGATATRRCDLKKDLKDNAKKVETHLSGTLNSQTSITIWIGHHSRRVKEDEVISHPRAGSVEELHELAIQLQEI